MGVGPEASPKQVGRFIWVVGIALVLLLGLFLLVFAFKGHKSSILKQTGEMVVPAQTAGDLAYV